MTKIAVHSPYDGHLIKEVPKATAKQAQKALSVAYAAYRDRDQWMKPYERRAILEKTLGMMRERRDQLAHDAAEEGGKPLMDSLVEADRAIQGVQVAIEHIGQLQGEEIPMNLSVSSAQRMAYTFREPCGVVLSISAFNHPLNLIVHQVIPAIAVGAPVIVKPAEATPISCFNLVNILYEAGLDEKWCQVLLCDNDIAEEMVTDSRVSFLSFIGSAKVGWYLRAKLPAGARCALEHGGAAPVIFTENGDVKTALPLLVKGGFYHAGQVCVSVQRVFAHESLAESLARDMATAANKLKVGNPVEASTEVGPLIRTREVDRVHEWVQEAVAQGAELLCGGDKLSDTCYQPTVLYNPPAEAKVSTSEIFGPVVCVYAYQDRLRAIEQANSLGMSFQASVFTDRLEVGLDTMKRLDATAVMINDHTAFRVDWMPFGGRMDSGLGMGGIPYSMRDMSCEKLFVIKSSVL